jgi:hypothetical protein
MGERCPACVAANRLAHASAEKDRPLLCRPPTEWLKLDDEWTEALDAYKEAREQHSAGCANQERP